MKTNNGSQSRRAFSAETKLQLLKLGEQFLPAALQPGAELLEVDSHCFLPAPCTLLHMTVKLLYLRLTRITTSQPQQHS
jgi:hypothetical protein